MQRRAAPLPMRDHAALTLIELLVVIAIIGILASLLLPSIARGKRLASATTCRNNLRQWGVCLTLYLDDHGTYPPYVLRDVVGGPDRRWYERLRSYTSASAYPGTSWAPARGSSVDLCPDYFRMGGTSPSEGYPWVATYGYNAFGFMQPGTGAHWIQGLGLDGTRWSADGMPAGFVPVRDNDLVSPSDMIAMGDTYLDGDSRHPFGYDRLFAPDATYLIELAGGPTRPETGSLIQLQMDRHAGRWNVVFTDGHTEAPKPRSLFDYRSDTALERWHRDPQPHRETLPAHLP